MLYFQQQNFQKSLKIPFLYCIFIKNFQIFLEISQPFVFLVQTRGKINAGFFKNSPASGAGWAPPTDPPRARPIKVPLPEKISATPPRGKSLHSICALCWVRIVRSYKYSDSPQLFTTVEYSRYFSWDISYWRISGYISIFVLKRDVIVNQIIFMVTIINYIYLFEVYL